MIERPDCKRRWSTEGWDKMQLAALRDWLLDRPEAPELWAGQPTLLSVAQLADRVGHDQDFRAVLDLWIGHDNYDPTRTLGLLIADEHVPYLPAQRYKPTGLRKRAQWEPSLATGPPGQRQMPLSDQASCRTGRTGVSSIRPPS